MERVNGYDIRVLQARHMVRLRQRLIDDLEHDVALGKVPLGR